MHNWLAEYKTEGLAGLADHSHRPRFQPRQLDAGIEAMICQLRGAHPRWGPRRLEYELAKASVSPVPSRSTTIYRVLVRRCLVPARQRKRRRQGSLPGPLAIGRQIGPGVAGLGVGQGLLVPIRIARSWEAEHRPLPGRGPLDDLEPV